MKIIKAQILTSLLTIGIAGYSSANIILFSDDFSTNTLVADYTTLGVTYNSVPETVTISRNPGNFLQISETFNLDTLGAIDLKIAFDYSFGVSMFGSEFTLQYNDNNGTGWQNIDVIPRTGTGQNDSQLALNPYSITIAEGGAFDFTDGASIRLIDVDNSGSKGYNIDNLRITANIPEPSSTALLGLGGLALILRRRR